jgi:hypothetical protein
LDPNYISGFLDYPPTLREGCFFVRINRNVELKVKWYGKRLFSTFANLSGEKGIPSSINTETFNLNYISGFTDGEGCFYLKIPKSKTHQCGWQVHLSFTISLHSKDRAMLELTRAVLGVGQLYTYRKDIVELRVQAIKDIDKLIKIFDKYPFLIEGIFKDSYFVPLSVVIGLKSKTTLPAGKPHTSSKSSLSSSDNFSAISSKKKISVTFFFLFLLRKKKTIEYK